MFTFKFVTTDVYDKLILLKLQKAEILSKENSPNYQLMLETLNEGIEHYEKVIKEKENDYIIEQSINNR